MFSTVVKVESGGRGEDRAIVRQDGERLLVVVADGAGGTGAGAIAAQTVCDLVLTESSGARSWNAVLRDTICACCGQGRAVSQRSSSSKSSRD